MRSSHAESVNSVDVKRVNCDGQPSPGGQCQAPQTASTNTADLGNITHPTDFSSMGNAVRVENTDEVRLREVTPVSLTFEVNNTLPQSLQLLASEDITCSSTSKPQSEGAAETVLTPDAGSERNLTSPGHMTVAATSQSGQTTPGHTTVAATSQSGQTTPGKRKLSPIPSEVNVSQPMSQPMSQAMSQPMSQPMRVEWVARPRLLTLNPLCLPVGLLKFKPKQPM